MLDDDAREFLARNVKGLLADLLEWMEERNTELRQGAFADATPAEVRLFASLRGRERSISELARAMAVSRQAVHRTAHRLAAHGVVRIIASPRSRRDKVVQITEAGHEVQRMAARNLSQIESEMKQLAGAETVETLRAALLLTLEKVNASSAPEVARSAPKARSGRRVHRA